MRHFSALLVVICLAVPGVAWSGSVYLNGVKIDGVTNQRFERAAVRIDDKGNVFIEAAGYAVKSLESGSATPAGATTPAPTAATAVAGDAKLTKRYWLVTEQTAPGMTDFDIDVYINSKWVRKLRNADEQIVTEVTRYLAPGKNTVLLIARKMATGTARKSFSAAHAYRVIVGEGNVGGDNVMIDHTVLKFECTAAEGAEISKEYTFTTR